MSLQMSLQMAADGRLILFHAAAWRYQTIRLPVVLPLTQTLGVCRGHEERGLVNQRFLEQGDWRRELHSSGTTRSYEGRRPSAPIVHNGIRTAAG